MDRQRLPIVVVNKNHNSREKQWRWVWGGILVLTALALLIHPLLSGKNPALSGMFLPDLLSAKQRESNSSTFMGRTSGSVPRQRKDQISGEVLGLADEVLSSSFIIRLKTRIQNSLYADNLEVGEDLLVTGDSELLGDLDIGGVLTADTINASNIVNSLLAGDGIELSTTKTTATNKTGDVTVKVKSADRASTLSLFKIAKVGSEEITADSNTDTLEFVAGTGISLSANTTDDKLTIATTGLAWTDGGTSVYLTTSTDSVGIGTSSPAYKLHVVGDGYFSTNLTVAGTTTLNGASFAGDITLGDAITDNITFTGRLASGTSIIPIVDLGSDLGTAALRFNNIYAANLEIESGFTSPGQLLVTYDPADTTFAESSLRINITSPESNEYMIGIGQGGYQRAGFDAEGDLIIAYSDATSIPSTDNPLMVYAHSGTPVASISATGVTSFRNSTDSTAGFIVYDQDGGTPILNIDTENERVGVGTETPGARLQINAGAADNIGQIIRAASSQTARLLKFENSSGTEVWSVRADGTISDPNQASYWSMSSGIFRTIAGSATTIPLLVRGAASQTANLTGWYKSDNSLIASITPSGGGYFAGLTSIGLTAPTSPLHVYAAYSDAAGMVVDQRNSGNIFVASASGVTKFVISNGGNVGIGTTAPASALDIVGGAVAGEGSNLVTNGDFAVDGTWSKGTGWTIDTVTAVKAAGTASNLTQNLSEASGNLYHITFDYTRTAGTLSVAIGGVTHTTTYSSASGTGDIYILATGTGDLSFIANSAFAGTVDNVVVTLVSSSLANTTFRDSDGTIKQELRVAGTSNLFLGLNAGENNLSGGTYNIFIGEEAGLSNTIGDYNVFQGYQAGKANNTGYNNIFQGYQAGYTNTTGYSNNFVGYRAGYSTTYGNQNNYFGYQAGFANTWGYNNNFFGYAAGQNNTTGATNNFFGLYAGLNNTTGDSNSYFGHMAGDYSQTGSKNTAIGYLSFGYGTGAVFTGADNNTIIGTEAGYNLGASDDANIMLGYQAGYSETGSNKLYIENSNSATPLIYGEFDTDYLKFTGRGEFSNSTTYLSGKSALIVDQYESQDIFTASASGTPKFTISNVGNVGIGATSFGTDAASVLAIANGTAPSTSPADMVQLYAVDYDDGDAGATSELFVRDEDGNATNLSPHNFSLIGDKSEDMAWSFYSERDNTAINADMTKALRIVEQLSGEKLIYIKDLVNNQYIENGSIEVVTQDWELADEELRNEIGDLRNQIAGIATQSTQTQNPVETRLIASVQDELSPFAKWSINVWEFISEVVFKNKVRFEEKVEFNADQVGQVTITASQSATRVLFQTEFSQPPIVILTPASNNYLDRYFVDGVETSGFSIIVDPAPEQEIKMNYHAFSNGSKLETASDSGVIK